LEAARASCDGSSLDGPPVRNERPGLRRALAALEHRDYRLFYVALLMAGIGGQVQTFANVLQIYELTGSALHLGLTGVARAVPIIVLSLMGGVIADRVDRLRFSMVAQAFTGSFSVALAGLTLAGLIDVWHIYLFTFLGSAVQALNTPARSALIPNLVPRNHLLNAIALHSTVWQSSNIVGPMIAGAAIAAFGFVPTYLLNGVAQLLTIGALALIRVGRVEARPRQSPLRGLLEGLSFVQRRSIILVLLATDCAESAFGRYQALLPIFAANVGAGAGGLGLLTAAPGVGSLVGAALIMSLGDIRYKGLVIVGAILAYCGALVLLAVSPWLGLSVVATFLLGVFDSLQATPRGSVIQLMTPDELRGRVSSFQNMLTTGLPSLGQAQNGVIASFIGAPLALIVGAAACAAVQVGLVAARPDLRAEDLGAEEARALAPLKHKVGSLS
jgi:ENTS family enterobactin (siderophore) exporter